jgi:hypothetical protein
MIPAGVSEPSGANMRVDMLGTQYADLPEGKLTAAYAEPRACAGYCA